MSGTRKPSAVLPLKPEKITLGTLGRFALGLFKIAANSAEIAVIAKSYVVSKPKPVNGKFNVSVSPHTKADLHALAKGGTVFECVTEIYEELHKMYTDQVQRKLLLALIATIVFASLKWLLMPIVVIDINHIIDFIQIAHSFVILILPT